MHNGYLLKLFGKLVDNLLLLFLLSRIEEDIKLWILDEALSPGVGGVGVPLLFEDLRPPPPPPGGGGGGAHLEKVAPPKRNQPAALWSYRILEEGPPLWCWGRQKIIIWYFQFY